MTLQVITKSSSPHCLMVLSIRNHVNGWCQPECLLLSYAIIYYFAEIRMVSLLGDVLLSRFHYYQGSTLVHTLTVPAALAALLVCAE